MKLVSVAAACAALTIHGSGVHAAETLVFRTVSHSTGAVSVDPGDGAEGHLLGSARFVGMSFYEDGQVARIHYLTHFDYIKGSGSYESFQTTIFSDGSVLRARNTGTAVTGNDGVTTFPDGKSEILGGSGKYADATGTCSYTGVRVLSISDGGGTAIST